MHSNQFEAAFSDFIDGRVYDKTEQQIFSLTRAAFAAGWQAAGGPPPTERKLFELIEKEPPAD